MAFLLVIEMKVIAKVNRKYFAAINLFSAVKDVRYYLNSVYIEPHPDAGVVLVATDGHRMGVIHDPEGHTDYPIIVGGISKQLISGCKKKSLLPSDLFIGERGAVVRPGLEEGQDLDPFDNLVTHMSRIEILDAKYPDWRKVLPKKESREDRFPAFNPKYLAALHDAAEILVPGKWNAALELFSSGRDTSIVARINSADIDQRFVGIIMPMRSDSPKSILPDWLTPKQEEEKGEEQ